MSDKFKIGIAVDYVFKGFTLLKKVIIINNQYCSQYDLNERKKTNNVNYG